MDVMKQYNPIDCWLKAVDEPEIIYPGECVLDRLDEGEDPLIFMPSLRDLIDWTRSPLYKLVRVVDNYYTLWLLNLN